MGRSPEEIFLHAVMSACSEMGSQLKLQAVSPNRERSCSLVFRRDESLRACVGGSFLHIAAFFSFLCVCVCALNQRVGTHCLGKNSDWRGQKQRALKLRSQM